MKEQASYDLIHVYMYLGMALNILHPQQITPRRKLHQLLSQKKKDDRILISSNPG